MQSFIITMKLTIELQSSPVTISFIFPSIGDFERQHSLFPLADLFRCLTKVGSDLQANTLTSITEKKNARTDFAGWRRIDV